MATHIIHSAAPAENKVRDIDDELDLTTHGKPMMSTVYDREPIIKPETELKGGRTNYYLVYVKHPQREEQPPYQAECEDIIEALGLTFNEANIFKEIWRSANARQQNGKPGHNALYGAQKMVHYAKRILRKYELESK